MSGETVQFEKLDDGESRREVSSIAFPYLDQDTAVDVSRAIYNRAGLGACELDELAAEMHQVVSGAFRLKTGTARIFGLIDKEGKSSVRLSDLGILIISQETERAARAESFMRVPLFEKIYEAYRGHLLPPMKALEREMQKLGVSSKQTDKARQAFERSAKQAGYFDSGDDRLVRPKADLPTKRVAGDEDQRQHEDSSDDHDRQVDDKKGRQGRGGGDGGSRGFHPLIEGLLRELPAAGVNGDKTDWPVEERATWLQLAALTFAMLYTGNGTVKITIENGGSK